MDEESDIVTSMFTAPDCPPALKKMGEKIMDLIRKVKPRFYRLDRQTHETTKITTEQEFIEAMRADKQVRRTLVAWVEVSTVFLPIDHGSCGNLRVFETMVFDGGGAIDMGPRRYATWDEAVEGHKRIVAEVKKLPAIREFMKLPRKRRRKLARTRWRNQWSAELARTEMAQKKFDEMRGEQAISE